MSFYQKLPIGPKKVLKNSYFFLQKARRKIFPLDYPVNQEGRNYIHLGCGEINDPEFINIDGRYFPHIHHIGNVEKLHYFPDKFADLIYTSHTLEHIRMSQLFEVLTEWKRVLKPGGILRISVPDFDCITRIYQENNRQIDSIWFFLLGNQDYKENFHYSVFNKKFLADLLIKVGFSEAREWIPGVADNYNFDDWAGRKVAYNGKEYAISLNIEAVR